MDQIKNVMEKEVRYLVLKNFETMPFAAVVGAVCSVGTKWHFLPSGLHERLLWEGRGAEKLHILTQEEYDNHDCHAGMDSGCEVCVQWFQQEKNRHV